MGCVSSNQLGNTKTQNPPELERNEMERPREFEAGEYANFLHKALLAKNEEAILNCLQECSAEERLTVRDKYQATHKQLLLTACQRHLSSKAALTALHLLEPRDVAAARFLHDTLEAGGRQAQQSVIEIVCCWTEEELQEIIGTYENMFGVSARDTVKEKMDESVEIQDIVMSLLTVDRPMNTSLSIEECASQLVEGAAIGNLFGEDQVMKTLLTSYRIVEIRDILELYLQKCQRDIIVEVEKEFPTGSTRHGYVTLAKVIRNPWLHLSEKIHELLSCSGESEQRELLYTVLIQKEDELRHIKQTYKSTFFESLSQDVKQDVQDPLVRRVLLKTLK